MKRNVLSLLLASMMLVSALTGCGGKETAPGPDDTIEETTQSDNKNDEKEKSEIESESGEYIYVLETEESHSLSEDRVDRKEYLYNVDGTLKKCKIFSKDGECNTWIDYEYVYSENEVTEIEKHYQKDEYQCTFEHKYGIGEDGSTRYEITRDKYIETEGERVYKEQVLWTYDENWNPLEYVRKVAGFVEHTLTFEYDENKILTRKHSVFGPDNYGLYEYQYDEEGKMISEKYSYTPNGYDEPKSIDETVYEYDENGILIKETKYNEKGTVDSEITYDTNGNILTDTNGVNLKNEYDEEGRLVGTIHMDSDGDIKTRYEYLYDENGNVTRENRYKVEEGQEDELREYVVKSWKKIKVNN